MPKNREDTCVHAIQNYLQYGINKKFNKTELLDDLIMYYMGYKSSIQLINENSDPVITRLKSLCNAKDLITRSAFLISLTNICSKTTTLQYGNASIPTQVLAQFNHLTHTNRLKPINFDLDLNFLAELPQEILDVYILGLKTYVPNVIFYGEFVDNAPLLNTLNKIVTNLQPNQSISYHCECIGQMGSAEMPVFLSSVSKASSLELNDAHLDKWTPDDFKHFVKEVKYNPNLNSLSLRNTNLGECCENPRKFKYILEIIGLSQLKSLNLHHNHLGNLPEAQLKILNKAIDNSPIKHIGLAHVKREKEGVLSKTGIFANSTVKHLDRLINMYHAQENDRPYSYWGMDN